MPPKLKLTPEEKKAIRIQKKAQKKIAKIEKKKQLKRDILTREIKYSYVSLQKYEKEWKQMLVKIALPQMRDDLDFAWNNFERTIDCKDFTISLLMDELKLAERQYMMNFKNHIEHIDKFIDKYRETLEELKQQHEFKVSNLRSQYEIEFEEIKDDFTEEDKYLKTISYMLGIAEKAHQGHMRAEYFSKLEEEDGKNSQNLQKMRLIFETVQINLSKGTQIFLRNYHSQVRDRKQQYDNFRDRDESMQILLLKQIDKLRRGYDLIKRLKQNLQDTQKILGRQIKDLEEEYDFFYKAFNFFKHRLIIDRQKDTEKMTLLTSGFNETNDYLEKLRAKCEQILHIGAVCRKLETQEEKITPFPEWGVNVGRKLHEAEESITKDYVPEMFQFFQRVGQVESLRYAISEEKLFLKTENKILKIKIHKYCQCLACPIQKKNIWTKIKHVTEGTHEYLKYRKQGFDNFKGNVNFDDIDEDNEISET